LSRVSKGGCAVLCGAAWWAGRGAACKPVSPAACMWLMLLGPLRTAAGVLISKGALVPKRCACLVRCSISALLCIAESGCCWGP
jgi:hypothetical protein